MLNQEGILGKLEAIGVVRRSHFPLTSGKHTDQYVEKRLIYRDERVTAALCEVIAERSQIISDIEAVVAPAEGGRMLAPKTAFHLKHFLKKRLWAFCAEKSGDGSFAFSHAQAEIVNHKNVLVVDDVVTTGGSLNRIAQLTRECGGTVVGASVLWNRGDITLSDLPDIPTFFSVVKKKLPAWDAASCPLCLAGVPLDKALGH